MIASAGTHLYSPSPLPSHRRITSATPRPWPRFRSRANALLAAGGADRTLPLAEAAKYAVDENVKSGMVVGLGAGLASGLAIQHLGRRLRGGDLKNIVGIPMSVSGASEAAKAGIPLDHYQDTTQIDFAFDDADAIEEGSLAAVVGRRRLEGGESILQEKRIIKAAKKLALIIDQKQHIKEFEGSIPVVVQSVNWLQTAEEIDDMFLGDAEVWRRPAFGSADPLGGDFPFVTKEGHHILDVIFTSPVPDLAQVAKSLDQIDGVVDHGLIVNVPFMAITASEDGIKVIDALTINATNEV